MKIIFKKIILVVAVITNLMSCTKEVDVSIIGDPVLTSNSALITDFDLMSADGTVIASVNKEIDTITKTIRLTYPFGTNVSALKAAIKLSEEAIISPDPNTAQDFSENITYTTKVTGGQETIFNVSVFVPEMTERDALLSMYKASGNSTFDWDLDATDINSWMNVTADEGKVIGLQIFGVFLPQTIFPNENVKNLIHLKSLNTAGITDDVVEPFSSSKQLEVISFISLQESNQQIPDWIFKLPKLKSLSIDFSAISNRNQASASSHILNLDKKFQSKDLEAISIFNYKISEFPTNLLELKNLKTLVIDNATLTSIPPELNSLEDLETLSFSRNKFTNLPDEIGELKKLKTLTITKNPDLTKIPKSICDLESTGTKITKDETTICEP